MHTPPPRRTFKLPQNLVLFKSSRLFAAFRLCSPLFASFRLSGTLYALSPLLNFRPVVNSLIEQQQHSQKNDNHTKRITQRADEDDGWQTHPSLSNRIAFSSQRTSPITIVLRQLKHVDTCGIILLIFFFENYFQSINKISNMNSIKRMTSSMMSERRCTFPATLRDLLPLLFFTLSPYCNQFTLFLSGKSWKSALV